MILMAFISPSVSGASTHGDLVDCEQYEYAIQGIQDCIPTTTTTYCNKETTTTYPEETTIPEVTTTIPEVTSTTVPATTTVPVMQPEKKAPLPTTTTVVPITPTAATPPGQLPFTGGHTWILATLGSALLLLGLGLIYGPKLRAARS